MAATASTSGKSRRRLPRPDADRRWLSGPIGGRAARRRLLQRLIVDGLSAAQRVQNTGATPAMGSIFVSYSVLPLTDTRGVTWTGCSRSKCESGGCGFILAMMAAPFIALIYGFGFGLAVLTVGLLLTAALAFDARDQVDSARRRTVLAMAVVALVLAIATGLAAVSQYR